MFNMEYIEYEKNYLLISDIGEYMSKLPFEVLIDYPLYKSTKGLYFIGETPIISGQSKHALAVLNNPFDSERILYVNAITITNISDKSLSAEFYLRSNLRQGIKSKQFTCVNTAISPIPMPAGSIEYFTPIVPLPSNGIAIFSRIVPPKSTLVVDGGQIILGQKQSLAVYIGGFLPVAFEGIRFAFGWSEKKTN